MTIISSTNIYDNNENDDDYDIIDNDEGELTRLLLETWDGLGGIFSVPLRPGD